MSPSQVSKGELVTIKLNVENADYVELQPGGQVNLTDSITDKPLSNSVYRLTARNNSGTVSDFRNVFVNDPNSPKLEETKPPQSHNLSLPTMAGTWQEISSKDPAHPLRLKIVQAGSQISCYISYTQVFADTPFLQANISQGKATTRMPQGCAQTFQHAGFNYSDNPSFNEFDISLTGSTLLYEQDTHWTSPCDGHPIGVEQTIRRLERRSQ